MTQLWPITLQQLILFVMLLVSCRQRRLQSNTGSFTRHHTTMGTTTWSIDINHDGPLAQSTCSTGGAATHLL
ncbi:MAG: hypothetical protein FJW94_01100 [Actinobacteria bacterium]|nr:hypothetical protein [Actinomycetota bacterium]